MLGTNRTIVIAVMLFGTNWLLWIIVLVTETYYVSSVPQSNIFFFWTFGNVSERSRNFEKRAFSNKKYNK